MKLLIALFACAAMAQNPTRTVIDQQRGPSSATGTVLVVLPNGRVAVADTSGLEIVTDAATGKVTLRPTGGGSQQVVEQMPVLRPAAATPTWDLPHVPASGSLMVFRNGMLLTETDDYSFVGQRISFVTSAIPQAGDILRARYRQ